MSAAVRPRPGEAKRRRNICDGSCMPKFVKALHKKFDSKGTDLRLPLAQTFDLATHQWRELVEPPQVKWKEGRRWVRLSLILPFCGVCGKKTS